MKIELNDDQLKIIRRALNDAIEKHIGVSEAQGAFLNNIDNGMNMKKAKEQFEIDNRKEWEYLMYVEKNPLYLLYDYLFNR